ncbi:MAG: hypothetical protein OXD01_13205 [Gammaproteobacteria bacterium]|nr:hypothetical protein [Gammaproteobacteria bacterium]
MSDLGKVCEKPNNLPRLPIQWGLVLCIQLFAVLELLAQESAHLRFAEGEGEWQGELQTAITRYQNDSGQTVDLIAAIHIADSAYFDRLNQHFETLEVLLFELVADVESLSGDVLENESGEVVPGSTLGLVQTLIADYLNLEFQLQGIDYGADNFLHADLTATELEDIMASRDESFFSMFLNMAQAQMEAERKAMASNAVKPSRFTFAALMEALVADNQPEAIKFLVARELARSGGLALSPEIESELTILGERNRVALEALAKSLSAGNRSIGLFYGAAHMPGLVREIIQTMGFRQTGKCWLTAWQLSP